MKGDSFYIDDILEQADFILELLPNVTKDEVMESVLYQNALIRSLEVIGEAAKRFSSEFQQMHPQIPTY
ncbi:MAG: DUF86 domain-containing protein [Methanocorpusculum sp.]|nr:DUF86 domain-containing protein [Methanocorpusculum sp.]